MADVLAFVTGVFLLAVILFLVYRELYSLDKERLQNELKQNKHQLARYLLLGFIFFSMLFIPKILLDDSEHCIIKPVNATVTGSLTEYDYDRVCFENENTTHTTFFRFVFSIIFIGIFYWLYYLFKFVALKIQRWSKR